jgi:cell division protein FtsL
MKEQFFETANQAIDAGLFWRGSLAQAVRKKDYKGVLWGILAVSFLLFFYVWQHMQVVKLGYEVQALKTQKQQLTNEYYYMKYRMHDVNSLSRIEQIAHDQLHMETPRTDQVVILDDGFSLRPRWFTFWKKTAAKGGDK